ncbi:MAG: Crp/Fnr family transcriptional regulator [Azonexus sp.]
MALSASEMSALGASGLLGGLMHREPFCEFFTDADVHRRHTPGESVIRKGSTPAGMYLVVHGSLEVVLSNRNGVEHVVRIARTGHCMGLENALTGTPSAYELRTLTEASVVLVPMATLANWIDASVLFARRLMNLLADDVADLYEELEGLQNRSTIERLACYLHCGEGRVRRGEPLRSEYNISLPYMKLAQRLGASQPHLSRALRNLEEAGMIDREGRRIRITDRHAFARLLCPTCQQAVTRNDVLRPKS